MEHQLSDLKLETIPSGEQYLLYYFYFSDHMCGEMNAVNFTTKEMAQEGCIG